MASSSSDKIVLEVPEGTGEVTVFDGVESHTYRPSKGVLTVTDREHLGAVIAVTGATIREGADEPEATPAPSDKNGA